MCIQSTFSYSFSADRHVKQHHALANVEGNCLFSRMIFLPLDIDIEVGYWVVQQFTPGSLGTPILFFHCPILIYITIRNMTLFFSLFFARNPYCLWAVFSIII